MRPFSLIRGRLGVDENAVLTLTMSLANLSLRTGLSDDFEPTAAVTDAAAERSLASRR